MSVLLVSLDGPFIGTSASGAPRRRCTEPDGGQDNEVTQVQRRTAGSRRRVRVPRQFDDAKYKKPSHNEQKIVIFKHATAKFT